MTQPLSGRAATWIRLAYALVAVAAMTGCSTGGDNVAPPAQSADDILDYELYGDRGPPKSTLLDLFRNKPDVSRVGAVNKYIWNASLEILDFLPVRSVDPFTGVITTGYGTPPGGGRAYRATVYISDPALDARSLKVALQSRGGPVAASTSRAVEDAILTRARQLRGRDSKL